LRAARAQHAPPLTPVPRYQGAEAREIYLGKLFGYGAIVRAVREASAADAKDVAVTAQLAQEIASLARKKGAMRLPRHAHRPTAADARHVPVLTLHRLPA
jgi:hypothetical protein